MTKDEFERLMVGDVIGWKGNHVRRTIVKEERYWDGLFALFLEDGSSVRATDNLSEYVAIFNPYKEAK